ncbi:hypothetical protein JCM10207_000625 [Rhodosporidiobolus poonsookiae]
MSLAALRAPLRLPPALPLRRLNLRPFSTGSARHAAQQDKKLRMIILGAPGAGKGTLSDWLIDKYDIETVVVGQLLRNEIVEGTQLGKEAEKIMKEGGLLSDETVIKLVEPELERLKNKNWLLDGFPRKASQAVLLDQVLAKQNDHLNFVASLKVPDKVIIDRIADRFIHLASGRTYNLSFNPPREAGKDDVTGEPLSQRPDDDPLTVRRRLEVFHAENDPLLAHYDGAMVRFEGETSREIWPALEKAVEEQFPGLKRRTTPRQVA